MRSDHERSRQMPVITVDIGIIDKDKKAGLVRELTAAASAVTKIPGDKFIVLINEMERDNIGVGGKLLSEIL
jgi:4-oxalocrotonate tautomerase